MAWRGLDAGREYAASAQIPPWDPPGTKKHASRSFERLPWSKRDPKGGSGAFDEASGLAGRLCYSYHFTSP